MLAFYLYALGLVVACAATGLTVRRIYSWQLLRSMAAVALNWLVGTAFAMTTGITDGWWFNIGLDALTAVVILYHPAGRWQAALGVSYCFQLLMHIGYGARVVFASGADAMSYYDWLTGIAWIQLLILGGWCGGLWVSGTRRRRGRSATTVGAVVQRVEETE